MIRSPVSAAKAARWVFQEVGWVGRWRGDGVTGEVFPPRPATVAVEQAGPAATAGLSPGLVITTIDGQAVRDVPELPTLLRRYDPGDEAVITVVDATSERSVTIDAAVTLLAVRPPSGSR